MSMRYRRLGSSGAVVSEFALGTMTFGSETPDDDASAQLVAFVDAGGTLIDRPPALADRMGLIHSGPAEGRPSPRTPIEAFVADQLHARWRRLLRADLVARTTDGTDAELRDGVRSLRQELGALGEDTARSLGAGTKSLGLRLTLGIGLMVGAATSVAGVIGFVGLVAPHLVRAKAGYRPGAILVPSMLMGAVLVLAADIIVRLLPTAYELQLGVFTSLVGAPFLVRAIRRARAAWLAA